jgi:NAD(P)-dependent dehydrogenase (short-subunit alcohol dehydrogenase family)
MPSTSVPPAPQLCVVTGAGGGLGSAIARGLAAQGMGLLLTSRRAEAAQRLAQEIRRDAPGVEVRVLPTGDLAELATVRDLARALRGFSQIHALINNAGAIFSRPGLTSDRIERTFALNVLAPFLLTTLLADRLSKSAPARVINVSSAAHLRQRLDWDHLSDGMGYRAFRAYGRSKLALLLLTHAFSRRLAGHRVTVNALHPGLVRTGFGADNPGGTGRLIAYGLRLVGTSPMRGARTAVYLGSSPEVAATTGEYFVRMRPHRSSAASYDLADEERLFAHCESLTGTQWKDPPAVAG